MGGAAATGPPLSNPTCHSGARTPPGGREPQPLRLEWRGIPTWEADGVSAISGFRVRMWLATPAPRNDSLVKQPDSRDLAAPRRPRCENFLHPLPKEGARNAGRPMRPQPRVQNVKSTRASHHESAGSSGVPHAMGCRLASCSPRRCVSPWKPSSPVAPGRVRLDDAGGRPDFGRDHTTWAAAQGDTNGAHLRPGPYRTASSSTALPGLTLLRHPDAPFVQGARPSAGLAPWPRPAARSCRVHRIPPRGS